MPLATLDGLEVNDVVKGSGPAHAGPRARSPREVRPHAQV